MPEVEQDLGQSVDLQLESIVELLEQIYIIGIGGLCYLLLAVSTIQKSCNSIYSSFGKLPSGIYTCLV